MKKYIGLAISGLCLIGFNAGAAINKKVEKKAQVSLEKGVAWLAAKQNDAGHWSNAEFPAITALALWALVNAGWDDEEGIDKAVKYILSCARANGAIYRDPAETRKGGGLVNYNTALCMVALHKVGRPELVPVVQKARTFMAKAQLLDEGSVFTGGMGYDPGTGRDYTDLSNSYIAFEAMRLTENVEDYRKLGDARADLDWAAAVKFIQRVHNHPKFNKLSWVSDDPDQIGGFAYHPENTRAGSSTNKSGEVKFNSFGSMTYAGMLSYIYAKVDKNDPRVTATYDWAVRHWTLDENVGTGKEGLFYYLNVLSKGMNAFGRDSVKTKDGKTFNWREEVINKMVSVQEKDGYWVNKEGRYWEADPVLVSAYSMLAIEYALGE